MDTQSDRRRIMNRRSVKMTVSVLVVLAGLAVLEPAGRQEEDDDPGNRTPFRVLRLEMA